MCLRILIPLKIEMLTRLGLGIVQQVGKAEFLVQRPEQVPFSVCCSTWSRYARFISVPVWTDRPIEHSERRVVGLARRAPGTELQVHRQGREAQNRGTRVVDLVTDRDNNEGANAFYRSQGFRLKCEVVTPEGRILNEYERYLSDGETGA